MFYIKEPRPQDHSEYECRKYRISQRKHCGTKQEHLLYTGYPGNGCNLIPDPHGPSNGNNKTAEVDQQYHRRKNKTVFGENVFLAKQGQEDKKSTNKKKTNIVGLVGGGSPRDTEVYHEIQIRVYIRMEPQYQKVL